MTVAEYQERVDKWIQDIGVRYFDVMTNTIILSEEVGEFAGLVARLYGEQSFKHGVSGSKEDLQDELGDMLFVITCLANQMEFNLEEILEENLRKKTERDKTRHRENPKL